MSGIDIERGGDGIVRVWLRNPGRLNALSDAMVGALCDAFGALATDDGCRLVMLRGRDGVFCAGRDLADLAALQGKGPDAVARMYGLMQRMNEAIHDYAGRGWSIIPIRSEDKRPLVRWEDYQHRHADEAEVPRLASGVAKRRDRHRDR